MTDHAIDIDITPGTEAARNWILSSWLRSNHDGGNGFWRSATDQVYWFNQSLLASKLLRESETLIATLAGEPDLFVGYVVWQRDVLHYVYVKAAYRRDGVASRLLEFCKLADFGKFDTCTHLGRDNAWLTRRGINYNPYALMLKEFK